MSDVVITGLGVVSPCGQSVPDFFSNLLAARSGISRVASDLFPAPNTLVAGQVDFDAASHAGGEHGMPIDRGSQFAVAAVRQAVSDAALDLKADDASRAGVYWGTGAGGATSLEDAYRSLFLTSRGRVRPATVVLSMNNAAAAHVSMACRFRGPVLNFSTACSSSAVSLGEAYRAIRHGLADVIVCGGSEATLTYGNLTAWDSMRALAHADPEDPSRTCKPFSANRAGLVLGEGAAALILESREHAVRRGARLYAEVAGYGNAADACNIAKPDIDGQVRAMRMALAEADVSPEHIGYINAHGTATPVGDATETTAIKQTFGRSAGAVCVSSTKALHGHLLGAAGALEAVVSVMALSTGCVPPTAHLDKSDASCDLDYVPHIARRVRLRAVMSNSFGFGGMNAVLVMRRP
jgi:3-oxoacyl-[acyl-carrier-protein] synthase II